MQIEKILFADINDDRGNPNGFVSIQTIDGEALIGIHGYQNDEMELSIADWGKLKQLIDTTLVTNSLI